MRSATSFVRQGTPGVEFVIVVSGRARVDRDGKTLRELGPGDFLGEISVIDGSPRTATVTALDPINALTVPRAGFLELIERIPVFRLEVLSALTERIRATAADPLSWPCQPQRRDPRKTSWTEW